MSANMFRPHAYLATSISMQDLSWSNPWPSPTSRFPPSSPSRNSPFAGRATPENPTATRNVVTSLIPELTHCSLCGSAAARPMGRGQDYDCHTCDNAWTWVECRHCQHQYLNPRPRLADASKIYPDDYFGATVVNSDPE